MFDQTDQRGIYGLASGTQEQAMAKTFMSKVFGWMTFAMFITAAMAYLFGTSGDLQALIRNPETGGMTGLGWIITLGPIGFVLLMSFGFQRLSPVILTLLFVTFAVLMGMGLSSILIIYEINSIFKTFLVTGLMFGTMAVLGYTTKTDLTRFGSILLMALIGIMIAMVVNIFMGSSTLDYIISLLGVLIFTGLTAYDVQRLKRIGMGAGEYGEADVRKLSILGALTLYLDFINLFLFLIRFLGDRK